MKTYCLSVSDCNRTTCLSSHISSLNQNLHNVPVLDKSNKSQMHLFYTTHMSKMDSRCRNFSQTHYQESVTESRAHQKDLRDRLCYHTIERLFQVHHDQCYSWTQRLHKLTCPYPRAVGPFRLKNKYVALQRIHLGSHTNGQNFIVKTTNSW